MRKLHNTGNLKSNMFSIVCLGKIAKPNIKIVIPGWHNYFKLFYICEFSIIMFVGKKKFACKQEVEVAK